MKHDDSHLTFDAARINDAEYDHIDFLAFALDPPKFNARVVAPLRENAGMVRPAPLVDRLLNARHTPDWSDELMTTTAVALCAGPNGTARLITELVNRIEDTK